MKNKRIFICSGSRANGCDKNPCIMVLPADSTPEDHCNFDSIREDHKPVVKWREDIDTTPPDWFKENT